MTSIFVDADNGLGSPRGDVDDGFALAALLRAGVPIAAIASVHGNTPEELADQNNRWMGGLCGYRGEYLRGASDRSRYPTPAGVFLAHADAPLRCLALGPLTNIAVALDIARSHHSRIRINEIIFVGGNSTSPGVFPPLWPHEFNLTKDRSASIQVFYSGLPLTIFPLDVLLRMRVRTGDLEALTGDVGRALREGSRRWFRRTRILKWRDWFHLPDLVAAMYVIDASLVRLERVSATFHDIGRIDFRGGEREVQILRDFDRDELWSRFVELINSGNSPAQPPATPAETNYNVRLMRFADLQKDKQEKALSDVFCIQCQKSFRLDTFTEREFNGMLLIEGMCPSCGGNVAKPVTERA